MHANLKAEKAIETMLSADKASAALGMQLVSAAPGSANVSMAIQTHMVNGHDIVHGGIIFSLADTAFACACNSHNIVNVAASCQINFVRPALLGDTLFAKATELSRSKRSGVYDVQIVNSAGKLIAAFRGQCMSLNKPVFEED